jgi:hypothetical protein
MRICNRIVLLACAMAVLAAAVPAGAQNIDAKEYWLDNGMQVLMVERHEAPTIMCAIFARVGSANETTGITGISHLFEHMMFKGTETIGTKDPARDREIMKELDALRAEMRKEERSLPRARRAVRRPDPRAARADHQGPARRDLQQERRVFPERFHVG